MRLDAIGDFFLWLDAARGLRQIYPPGQYRIILLGNSVWSELAEGLQHWDEVWTLDREKFVRNLYYRLKTLRKVRRTCFGIAIQPTFSREFEFGDSAIRAAGAQKKIGSRGDCSNMSTWQKRISDIWYTSFLPTSEAPMMELMRNAEFMRGLGVKEFHSRVPEFSVHVKLPAGFNATNYFVLFPGAGASLRQWPLANFKELAERIYAATGWTAVICGGPEEGPQGRALETEADFPLQNWAAKTSLLELIAIISGAHMLIGNETSAVHIAAAVSVPSICILGGGHYGRFMPYQVENGTERLLPEGVCLHMDCFNCNWLCQHKRKNKDAVQCIEKITVDMVWEAVQKILRERFGFSCDQTTSERFIT